MGLRLQTTPPKTDQERRQTRWRLKLLQNRQQPQPQSQMLRRKSRRPSGKQLFQSQRRLRRSPLDCRLKRLFELLSILLGRHGKIQNSRSLLQQIGRASCREKSVPVRVDLGGRRSINKKKQKYNKKITQKI